jgi:hypothetical protein
MIEPLHFVFLCRLGIISTLRSLEPIEKGREVLAFYSYSFIKAPIWFMEYFLDYIEENPHLYSGFRDRFYKTTFRPQFYFGRIFILV